MGLCCLTVYVWCRKGCYKCVLSNAADATRLDVSESSGSTGKDVNFSMSNSYQAALNMEVSLPGGLGFRPCFVSCFFQLFVAGCNKVPEFLLFPVLCV